MRIYSERGRVVVVFPDRRCVLSSRQAFDAATALMTAADEANGYGQAAAGLVPDPDPRTNPVRGRKRRR